MTAHLLVILFTALVLCGGTLVVAAVLLIDFVVCPTEPPCLLYAGGISSGGSLAGKV